MKREAVSSIDITHAVEIIEFERRANKLLFCQRKATSKHGVTTDHSLINSDVTPRTQTLLMTSIAGTLIRATDLDKR